MSYRNLVAAVAATALFPAIATAQTADVTDWSGPYVGLHGGYGFDNDKSVTNTGSTPNNILALSAGIRPTSIKVNREGALGGGQIGYNRQSGNIVYGLEADFSAMDSVGNEEYRSPQTVLTFPAGRRLNVRSQMNWMGTVRARAGYALGNGMIYATGGYAYGQVKGSAEFNGDTDAQINYFGRHKYVAQGWTAGGGLEFKPFPQLMDGKVSVRLEGLYYDLGKSNIYALQTATPAGFYRLGVDTRGYNGRVGINYAF